jgi:hypothetical protein
VGQALALTHQYPRRTLEAFSSIPKSLTADEMKHPPAGSFVGANPISSNFKSQIPYPPTSMFIELPPISRTKKSEKGSIRLEKSRFPREIGPPRRKRFLRPLEFSKKTRRGPEGSIRENRENAGKTSLFDDAKNGASPDVIGKYRRPPPRSTFGDSRSAIAD